jgi:hypothetical protein
MPKKTAAWFGALLCCLLASTIEARIPRSSAAKAAFARLHACPSTGRHVPHCPEYVIDHVVPLACGGADAPSNMQWQTIAAGKAKDAVELRCLHHK